MKFEVLLAGLDNPQPAVRVDVVRVLGMLDEVRALEALRQRYQVETDEAVRSTIAWAGKRLYEAQQAGYSTLNEVFRHFGVDREIENMPDPHEAEMMKKLEDSLDRDLRDMRDRASKRRMGTAIAAGFGGALVGGPTLGMAAAAGAMMPGAASVSSSMGGRPAIGTQRSPATAPSNAPIEVWVKRLREDPLPGKREQAALELAPLNNPAALPHLAAAFVSDSSPQVRQAAQKFGKSLYWSAIYWEMEQDGTLMAEMEKRLQTLGKSRAKSATQTSDLPGALPASAAPGPDVTATQEVDVSDILRKAKAARDARQKKK
jgi:hypothetical protein